MTFRSMTVAVMILKISWRPEVMHDKSYTISIRSWRKADVKIQGECQSLFSYKVVFASFEDNDTIQGQSSFCHPCTIVKLLLMERKKSHAPMFADFNQTKVSVHNNLVCTYSNKIKSHRWPYSIAMTLIDVVVIADCRLMQAKKRSTDEETTTRSNANFLWAWLTWPLMDGRLQTPPLTRSVRTIRQPYEHEDKDGPKAWDWCYVSMSPCFHVISKVSKPIRCTGTFCPRQAERKTRLYSV